MTKYAMAVDTTYCAACNTCATTCKVENNLPEGVWWNLAKTEGGDWMYTPSGEYPDNLSLEFYTYSCQHCDDAACVNVCPTGASVKREDGIVWIDYETCIGCKSCVTACPYDGVRTYIEEEPRFFLDFAMGDWGAQTHKQGVVEKCTFCAHRVDRGERPACVDVCPLQARYWGDLDDPESDISKLLASRKWEQLSAETDTGSNFYLLK